MLLVLMPAVVLWILALAIDTSTHPYDMLDAEPELVSGYHVDIGGVLFMVLYLGEGMLLSTVISLPVLSFLMLVSGLFQYLAS